MLAALVAVFLFGGGRPVWHDPFDIDRAIWLSYGLIPPLVVACLWWKRRLSWTTALLNTLEITILKFTLTYLIAMPLWALIGPPARPGLHQAVTAPRARSLAPPEVTPWPEGERGTVRGVVRGDDGRPRARAWVYVAAGLDEVILPWPAEARTIEVGARAFAAPVIAARRWQPLAGRSSDGLLHTLFFEHEGRVLGNVPLLPSGEPSAVPPLDADGLVSVHCAVHGERATLLLLHHPFAAESDAEGRFALTGVPALAVTIAAWHPAGGEARAEVQVRAAGEHRVDLELTR